MGASNSEQSEFIITYGKRLHVLVAPGMVYHDNFFFLTVVLYKNVSFSRHFQYLRKGIRILLVSHVTYFVSCCLNVYCLTQFCLNRIFGIFRLRSYVCVGLNWLCVCVPMVFHFWRFWHHGGGRDISFIRYMLRTRLHYPKLYNIS